MYRASFVFHVERFPRSAVHIVRHVRSATLRTDEKGGIFLSLSTAVRVVARFTSAATRLAFLARLATVSPCPWAAYARLGRGRPSAREGGEIPPRTRRCNGRIHSRGTNSSAATAGVAGGKVESRRAGIARHHVRRAMPALHVLSQKTCPREMSVGNFAGRFSDPSSRSGTAGQANSER